ncbi:hypothetical protein VSR34_27705 [Paraburkholderia sp. JHI2823]|jgi:hypothetical protein|uniref:hypothetical protein n=1 Tax=Paraburkholderia sp. JHI2823 TaxID=3112960 RepID=UPI003173605F
MTTLGAARKHKTPADDLAGALILDDLAVEMILASRQFRACSFPQPKQSACDVSRARARKWRNVTVAERDDSDRDGAEN